MTVTLTATFSHDTFRANHEFVSIPFLSIISEASVIFLHVLNELSYTVFRQFVFS